ncbi:MAG TPA: LacI family transcriptional regulator, partial [Clostridiaceae bacterium]|nr:LacI family transcriptional regulator [Clostridiaceae bacterium]
MTTTIRDIARKAGVSQATVSRVLNNSGYVKEETRQTIEKVIEELNYTPNAVARSLSKSETNVIGVVVPDINNPFFGEVIKGISMVADS